MKKWIIISTGSVFILALCFILHAQEMAASDATSVQTAAPDSIVRLTAESLGLSLTPAEDLPEYGTFWLVSTDGVFSPYPIPPPDAASLPVYSITTNGEYLVDGTDGKVDAEGGVSVREALASLADEVGSLIGEVQESESGGTMAAGMDSPSGFSPMLEPVDTNSLWLEITNYDGNFAYLNLHNATDEVYEVMSRTNLVSPGWQAETELFPGTDTNSLPFTVPVLDRTNALFFLATDWTGVDSDGDGVPDWWSWLYWGTTNLPDTNLDYSGNGNTFAQDYSNSTPPTVFSFAGIEVTNNYVSSMSAPAQLDVAGSPYYIAISVDDTNYASDSVWNSYSGSNVTVNLGLTEGWHDVWIGLRGHADNPSTAVWQWKRLNLDYTPPLLVVTSPTNTTVKVPLIQMAGFCQEPLDGISYDLTNALGLATNQDAGITGQYYDPNTGDFTTNYFECVDVPLTNGLNTIILHATDLAGNTTTTNFSVTLDYSTAINPVVSLTWPTNGMEICLSNFTLRGQVDDPTATVTASITDTNGDTNIITGEVERTGVLWVENLPLAEGTNLITLDVTNAAGHSSETNISVVKSDMTLMLTNIDDDLWQPTVGVSGLISDTTAAVYVNGVQGVNNGDGTWSANNVPVSSSGVASFDMKAVPSGGSSPDASLDTNKPVRLYVKQSNTSWVDFGQRETSGGGVNTAQDEFYSYTNHWDDGAGGGGEFIDREDGTASPSNPPYPYTYLADFTFQWPATAWENLEEGTCTMTGTNWSSLFDWEFLFWSYVSGTWGAPPIGWEHCGINLAWDYYEENDAAGVDYYHLNFRRTADTTLHLQTGGKALPGRRNLWQLNVSATAQAYPATPLGIYNQPGYDIVASGEEVYGTPVGTAIPAQNITVDGKPVGSDGNQWRAYADDDDRDVTPRVKNVDYYTFNLTPTKYTLKIQVNGTTRLSAKGVVSGANYCVGQKLTFSPYWLPSDPPFANDIAHWSLPGNYVNEYVPPPSPEDGSGYYTNDASLLAGETTSCWYIDKLQAGMVSIGMSLQFANGQIVPVAALGQLNVYRPTISGFQILSTNFFAALVPTNSPNELQLGDSAHGEMNFNVSVSSIAPFSGGANMVQLINASRSVANTGFGGGGTSSTSDGQFWLDNRNPLFGSDAVVNSGTMYDNTVEFLDQPGYGLNYIFGAYPANLCSIVDSFKDYIIFKPDGDGSIYVTLGRVFWSWSASTSKTNGVWSSPTYQVNGPSAPDSSNEFPVWPATYFNSIGSGD